MHAVFPALARLEFERRGESGVLAGCNVGHARRLLVASQRLAPDRIRVAGGVREQIAHLDRALGRPQPRRSVCGEAFENLRRSQFRQILCRLVVEMQVALLDQLHASGRREGLGHRQQPEDRVGRHRRAGRDICLAVGALVDDALGRGSDRDDPGNVVPRNASPQGGVNRFEAPGRDDRPGPSKHRPDPIESEDGPSHAAALKHCSACNLIHG
jgi:hypothetical protein